MIILVEDIEHAYELGKETKDFVFVTSNETEQMGWIKLLSDVGYKVMVHGEDMEEYLDKENIYYLHIEEVADTLKEFIDLINSYIKENEDFLNCNTTTGKLLFGIAKGYGKATVNTDNIFEIIEDRLDGKIYMMINVEESIGPTCVIALLEMFEKKAREWYGYHPEVLKFSLNNIYDSTTTSGDSVEEVLTKLHCIIYILKQRGGAC